MEEEQCSECSSQRWSRRVPLARRRSPGRTSPSRFLNPVPARRRHGRIRAADRRQAVAAAGQQVLIEEPGRRGRHGRRLERRKARTRRLQLVLRRRPPHHCREPVQDAALWPGEGLRADHRRRLRAERGGDPSEACSTSSRPCTEFIGYVKEAPRPAELRLGGQRHHAPPRGGTVQDHDRDLHGAHSLPRRGTAHARSARWPGRPRLRRPGTSAPQIKAGKLIPLAVTTIVRNQRCPNVPTVAGVRRAGLRVTDLVCALGAQGNAQGHSGPHVQGSRHRA